MPQTADITAIGLSCLIYAFMRIKHKIENKLKTSIGFQPDNSNLKKRFISVYLNLLINTIYF